MKQETLYNILSGAYGEVLETHAMWECIASLGIKPYKDGNQWCYLYGDNIQDGIVGFGETIFKAAWNFYSQIKTEVIAKCEYRGSSEIPNDLEEAAKKYAHCPFTDDDGNFHEDAFDANAYYDFISGSKWQKQHDAELIEIAYNDGITIGMTKQKEQMMKEAVEWTVEDWNPEPHPEITIPLNPEEYSNGDEVRVIVLKKED